MSPDWILGPVLASRLVWIPVSVESLSETHAAPLLRFHLEEPRYMLNLP
jgi:hypothetical protein